MGWAEAEFEALDLCDARRNRRVIHLVERLAERPTASLPGACQGWGDTQGAGLLLGNDAVAPLALVEPHRASTIQRMTAHPVLLCLQDTTELNFNGRAIAGLGPLSDEAQRGMSLHPTLAVSPARELLGILDAWMWASAFKDADGIRPGILESTRWVEGNERVAELAARLPDTRLVYVGDREADMRELMVIARDLGHPADYLVRARHNRVLPKGQRLWSSVQASEPLGEVTFTLPAGRGRKARTVRQVLYAQSVRFPDGRRGGGKVSATCLIAQEIDAPPGVKPIVWRLLTSRSVSSLEDAAERIDWSRARWDIEGLFFTLKEGCRVEALQLGRIERIVRALMLHLVIAWRIMQLMRLGRTLPDLDAELLLNAYEIKAADILTKTLLPTGAARLNEVIRLMARMGGLLGRKGDGEPGVKTLWLGLQRVMDVVVGLKYAHALQDP
ncbi:MULTISPECIES: IS4 family transposase [unclassified Thiocapsa]|uniref:IS4 family transposase n=1 Tax=unclassified Thiocapsa TaxID=2641286 RepID=UPI0035AF6C6C